MPKRIIMPNDRLSWKSSVVGDVVYYRSNKVGFISKDKWSSLYPPIGVVGYKSSSLVLIMGLSKKLGLSYEGAGIIVPNVTTTTDKSVAQNDWNGYDNTMALNAYTGGNTNYRGGYCWNYGLGGQQWYEPGLGELLALINSRLVINPSISFVGGDPFPAEHSTSSTGWCISSSTQYNASMCWEYEFRNMYDDIYSKSYYDNNHQVRPIFKIEL